MKIGQEVLMRAKVTEIHETSNGCEYTLIAYHDDAIICRADIITEDEVISLKSQHSMAFWHMKKRLDNGEQFKDFQKPHYLQLANECVFADKPMGRIVYISKDDLCIEEFKFENDAEMKADIKMELNYLNLYWDNKQPPAQARAYGYAKKTVNKEKVFDYNKPNECLKYCPYKDKCEGIHGKISERGTV